jgi:hypothetical protein
MEVPMSDLSVSNTTAQHNPPVEPIQRPQLGQWFTFHTQARKVKKSGTVTWTRLTLSPQRGMYVGWRTVHDCAYSFEYEYDEGSTYAVGYVFDHKRSHEVWLFVTGDRLNPVHVFPQDVLLDSTDEAAARGAGGE